MGNLVNMVANGTISIEELEDAERLFKRAKLVEDGIKACKKTIRIPKGQEKVHCYSFMAHGGDYEAIGYCMKDGTFICYSIGGEKHEVGRCNLNSFEDVFLAFENTIFAEDLRFFLETEINKAEEEKESFT